MKKNNRKLYPVWDLSELIALSLPNLPFASLLDFEGLDEDPVICCTVLPNGCGGLDWSGSILLSETRIPGTEYEYGTVSSDTAALTALSTTIFGVAFGTFDLSGLWLTAAWYSGLNVQIKGLLGGFATYDQTFIADVYGTTFLELDYLGVDKISISSFGGSLAPDLGSLGGGTNAAIDNVTVSGLPEGNAPAHVTHALSGLGLTGLAWTKRKKA
jgi:hypothetical protein